MRKLLILLCSIFFCLATMAQTSMFDSLDLILPELPDSHKYQVYQQLRHRLEDFEDQEQRMVAAHQFRNYAQEQEDSVMLRYALTVLRDLYINYGDKEKAAGFSRQLKELAGRIGCRVSEGYRDQHPLYGFRYTRLYQELKILEDPKAQLDFEIAGRPEANSSFQPNYSRERSWDPKMVYWIKMHLLGDPYGEGEYLFIPESGTDSFGRFLSWDTVDVYVLYEDGGLDEQQTGTALRPLDKEFRDGFNFFEVSLKAGERATLFLRLHGGASGADSEGIGLRMIEKASLLEFEGLRPLDIFQNTHKKAGYRYTPVRHSLELVTDASGDLNLPEIIDQWDDRSFFNGARPIQWKRPHWLKLRLLGDGEDAQGLLLSFPVFQSFRNIDVFLPAGRPGMYTHRTMGVSTAPQYRFIRHWTSLLPYELAPEDSVDIYLRLDGYLGNRHVPNLSIWYVDQRSFWPNWPYRMLLRGLVLGALCIFLLYFLLTYYLFRERVFLSFSFFLLGSGMFYLFSGMNRELVFMIYPTSVRCAHIMMIVGRTLLVLGFLQFGRRMLHLKNYFPRIAPWINGWLVVWLLVNGLDGAMAGIPSSVPMIWGFDPDQLLSFIIAGLAGIPFLFLFIMAIKTAGRGYTPAYFLVVAFVIIMICLVLLGTNIYWGDPMTLDHILVYLLQAGLFCSLIFLALGAHYHRKYSV